MALNTIAPGEFSSVQASGMNFPVLRNRSGEGPVWRRVHGSQPGPASRPAERQDAKPFTGISYDALSEERLLFQAGVPAATVLRLKSLAAGWGVSLKDAAFSLGAVRPHRYLRVLAAASGLAQHQIRDRVALRKLSPAPEPYRMLASPQPAPLEVPRGGVALNAERLSPVAISSTVSALGAARQRLTLTSEADLKRAIARTYGAELTERAANGLRNRNPRFSAATGLIGWQTITLTIAGGVFLGAAVFAPREAMIVYSAVLSLMFLITISLRTAAATHAFGRKVLRRKRHYRRLRDSALPRYTVMVAMFREARVLPHLVAGLRSLDYPGAKLDIKLVLEEVDEETIMAARAIDMPAHFEIVVVPDGKPRTKPRALNYALQFATGEYIVVFDAEDRPDPQQLRKAAAHFAEAEDEVVCLQGKLTFDNASENWLAKQFTIEYSSLFGGILPMLDRVRLPMPLGGTSNHFHTKTLRKLGGWDAHNVTEDADLGMRIYRAGLRAEVLDSVTYEEAACQPGNWLRQRTRWLKGWMQTYCVHMRQPVRLFRELGLAGFLSFQGHFAGIIIAALVHPWSYMIFAHDAAVGILFDRPETLFGRHILLIALINLVLGYASSLALGFFVLQDRRLRVLIPQLVFIPVYWLFISAACYRAVYQLITAPHYWEKTEHGVTRVRRSG